MRFDFTNPEYRKSDKFNIGIQKKSDKPSKKATTDNKPDSGFVNKLNSLFKKKNLKKDSNNVLLNEQITQSDEPKDEQSVLKKKFGSFKRRKKTPQESNSKPEISVQTDTPTKLETQEVQSNTPKNSDNEQLLDLNTLINMANEDKSDTKEPETALKNIEPLNNSDETLDIENNPVKKKLEELFQRLEANKKAYLESENKSNIEVISDDKISKLEPIEDASSNDEKLSKLEPIKESTSNDKKIDIIKPIEDTKVDTIEPIKEQKQEIETIKMDKNSNTSAPIQQSPIDAEDEFLAKNTPQKTVKIDSSFEDDFLENFVNSTASQDNNIITSQANQQQTDINNRTIPQSNRSSLQHYDQFRFTATANEFFRIWIVNVFLSVITLGIYSAWAKVRTNRFFYANTYIGGSNFEYNADPKKILIGRLIVVGLYGLSLVFSEILNLKTVSLVLFGLFVLMLPWIVRQAIRFRLKSTSFRNIRFRYAGKTKEFYKLFASAFFAFYGPIIFMILFSIFGRHYVSESLVLIITGVVLLLYFISIFYFAPVLYKKYKELVINNSYFGKDGFSFNATKKEIVKIFFKIILISVVALGLFAAGVALVQALFKVDLSSMQSATSSTSVIASIAVSIIYIAVLSSTKGVSDGYLSNFTRNNTTLGTLTLEGKINPFKLGFISFTNTIAIILSFGLLYPWAKIRYMSYKMENTYCACDDYDQYIESNVDDASAYGEESVDFFDIDIGV